MREWTNWGSEGVLVHVFRAGTWIEDVDERQVAKDAKGETHSVPRAIRSSVDQSVRRLLPRNFLGAATAISLALCVTAAVLWAKSSRGPVVFFVNPWEAQGFDGHIRFLYDGTFQEGENSVPLWIFALPFPIVLGARLWVERVKRRPARGRCARCGYDLRATPDRCPECGMVLSTQSTMRSPVDSRLDAGGGGAKV